VRDGPELLPRRMPSFPSPPFDVHSSLLPICISLFNRLTVRALIKAIPLVKVYHHPNRTLALTFQLAPLVVSSSPLTISACFLYPYLGRIDTLSALRPAISASSSRFQLRWHEFCRLHEMTSLRTDLKLSKITLTRATFLPPVILQPQIRRRDFSLAICVLQPSPACMNANPAHSPLSSIQQTRAIADQL
jgi:hypothetical protein